MIHLDLHTSSVQMPNRLPKATPSLVTAGTISYMQSFRFADEVLCRRNGESTGRTIRDCIDRNEEYLCDMDFSNVDLSGWRINGARLHRSTFANAKLEGTRFHGIACDDTLFDNANLNDAHFESSIFNRSSFRGIQALNGFFEDVILRDCQFDNANLRGTAFVGRANFYADGKGHGWESEERKSLCSTGGSTTSLLERCAFGQCDLSECCFVGKSFSWEEKLERNVFGMMPVNYTLYCRGAFNGPIFLNCDFKKAQLSGTTFADRASDMAHKLIFRKRDHYQGVLSWFRNGDSLKNALGSYFVLRNDLDGLLRSTGYYSSNSVLLRSNFTDATLRGVDLSGQDLRGSTFEGALLVDCYLDKCVIDETATFPTEFRLPNNLIDKRPKPDARPKTGFLAFLGKLFVGDKVEEKYHLWTIPQSDDENYNPNLRPHHW